MTAIPQIIPSSPVADFSGYSHILGNNEFDADMDIVESFIRAHENPDNVLAQSAVFNYYISRFLSYWDFTKEYIQGEQIIKDFDKAGLMTGKFLTPEEINDKEQTLLAMIEDLTQKFKTTQKLDLAAITNIFIFIANIVCFRKDPDSIDKRYTTNNEYPLPNKVGLFGLNTYVYARLKGIELIGIPTTPVFFDNSWGCSNQFISHDLAHASQNLISYPDYSVFKRPYYFILNDPSTTLLEKECHITNLWIDLHETFFGLTDPIDVETLPSKLLRDAESIQDNTGDDFFPLYASFKDFALSEDNIQSLLDVKSEWDQSKNLAYYKSAQNERNWDDIVQIINKRDQKYINKFRLYFILSFWYTYRYINNFLKQWPDEYDEDYNSDDY